MKYKNLLLIILACLLMSCEATGPKFKVSQEPVLNNALVYLYREDAFYLGGADAYFYVNDVHIVDVGNNGYTSFYLPKGNYKLRQEWGVIAADPIEFNMSLRAGQTVYYRISTRDSGPNAYRWKISQVSAEIGRKEISTTRYEKPFGINKLLHPEMER